ncbi:Putative HMP/thiamine import ATP-binding protein YkoD [Dermatophilus congolensis]|uniref:Putative HMP/thiamine import ATP-binding protein YkoD n=2 Tax=Dermatophilus congolensis TaxID=1863 RepID=A0A239VQ33_9MICO|nr:ABC transporter ATP-binding protein [Dermatophilus congolensis]SNV23758.1 Putative HMP/thiamine import ATP-binding protein YkoD [Dermatophilus congolensis]
MLSVKGLKKKYKAVVFSGVDFSAYPGSLTVIRGKNGSGKTTLLAAVGGLVPVEGQVLLDGEPLHARARQCFGLFDDSPLMTNLTGLENLVYLSGRFLSMREAEHLVEDFFDPLLLGRRVSSYSLGQKKRLSLAAVFLSDARVVLLDEPTNGLDDRGIEDFAKIVKAKKDAGCVLLASGHARRAFSQVQDHVFELDEGRLVQCL